MLYPDTSDDVLAVQERLTVCVACAVVPGPVGVSVVDEDQPPQPSSNTVAAKLRIAALLVTRVAGVIRGVRPPEETIQHYRPLPNRCWMGLRKLRIIVNHTIF